MNILLSVFGRSQVKLNNLSCLYSHLFLLKRLLKLLLKLLKVGNCFDFALFSDIGLRLSYLGEKVLLVMLFARVGRLRQIV